MFASVTPFNGNGAGSEFRVQADVYLPSTNAEIDKIRIWTGYSAEIYAEVTTKDSWVSVDQTVEIVNGTTLRFQAYDGSDLTPTTTEANVFYLKNIRVEKLIETPTAAYSLRKVKSDYDESAIRVRRSSDDTEQDIGFDANGDLDTAALTTFVNEEYDHIDEDFSSDLGWTFLNGTSNILSLIHI